jgi:hypothetical protein
MQKSLDLSGLLWLTSSPTAFSEEIAADQRLNESGRQFSPLVSARLNVSQLVSLNSVSTDEIG